MASIPLPRLTLSDRARFLRKCRPAPAPRAASVTTPCLIWKGGPSATFKIQGRVHTAASVSWALAGEWPTGNLLSVCGAPLCVAADHRRLAGSLELGKEIQTVQLQPTEEGETPEEALEYAAHVWLKSSVPSVCPECGGPLAPSTLKFDPREPRAGNVECIGCLPNSDMVEARRRVVEEPGLCELDVLEMEYETVCQSRERRAIDLYHGRLFKALNVPVEVRERARKAKVIVGPDDLPYFDNGEACGPFPLWCDIRWLNGAREIWRKS